MTVSELCSGDQLEVQAPTMTETSNRQSLFEITQILTVMSDLTYFHFVAWFCWKKTEPALCLSLNWLIMKNKQFLSRNENWINQQIKQIDFDFALLFILPYKQLYRQIGSHRISSSTCILLDNFIGTWKMKNKVQMRSKHLQMKSKHF